MRLPRDYVEHISRSNGGVLWLSEGAHYQLYPIRDESSIARLRKTVTDVASETLKMRRRKLNWPYDHIIIGGSDGDKLLISASDGLTRSTRLHVWLHEDERRIDLGLSVEAAWRLGYLDE